MYNSGEQDEAAARGLHGIRSRKHDTVASGAGDEEMPSEAGHPGSVVRVFMADACFFEAPAEKRMDERL